MSLLQLFANNAISLLDQSIGPLSTTLVLQPGLGAEFPQPVNPGEFFLVTLEDIAAPLNREIISISGRAGDVLTIAARGLEGTLARSWSQGTTLVDQRVTAETMRQAFLQPVAPVTPPAITGITIQDNGIPLAGLADTINFAGNVTVSGIGATKIVTVGNSTSSSIIQGSTTLSPINIASGVTASGSAVVYSQYQRGFKFFVTLFMPAGDLSCTFEVLGNVSGNLASNTEVATWARTSRIGYNFKGVLDITLNHTTKELDLTWTNNELTPVEMLCTRIQHLP